MLYASSSTALSKLPIAPDGKVLTVAAGIPSWENASSGTVTSVSGTADRITSTGGATPVLDIAANYAGQTSITTLGTISSGVWNGTTIAVASGGTGSTAFTDGSVVFSNGATLTQDNSNLFWDNTNNRLGLGTNTPLDTFHVVGAMELDHTAEENDDHAIEIVCNAAGFSDVKALDIDYITGALAAGDSEEVILINIDERTSTGGQIIGLQVVSTTEGTDAVIALKCGPGIDAIRQEVGTFGNMDSALNKAVNVLAALSSGGAGNISVFVADNDTLTIGDAATFGGMEIIVDTPASGSGIAPTFEYSTGVGTWATFSPADGTNGFRNTGVIEWDVADLAGFAVGTGAEYLIRITRTRNNLTTTPILDEVQISAFTEYKWDKNGNLSVNAVTMTGGDLSVTRASSGGTVKATVSNTSNTASSVANIISSVGGTSAGDATYQAVVSGTTTWTWGVDNSVTVPTADTFVIAQGTALGTNNVMSVATSGEINYPLQPAFSAILASTVANVTGDGTAYNIAFDTEVFDQGGDFSSTTFTAPVTGRYHFSLGVLGGGILVGHTSMLCTLATSNRSYAGSNLSPFTIVNSGQLQINYGAFADMDAADTAVSRITVSGGTLVVDVISGGATSPRTFFGGYLEC